MKKFISNLRRIKRTRFRKLNAKDRVIKVVMLLLKLAIIAALAVAIGLFVMILAIPFILLGGMNRAVQDQANRTMRNWRYIKY